MNDSRWKTLAGYAAAGGAALAPLLAACSGSSTPASSAAYPPATASVAMGQAPPGYPGAAPAGYPTAAPAGYPAPQPAYPAQPGYPAQPTAPAAQPGYPQQPAAQPATAPTYAPLPGAATPSAAPSAAPAGTLAPVDPNSLQGILTGLQGALQGTLVSPGGNGADLTELGLKAQALRVAPGMTAEGDELKQTLTEGQHAVMMVTLQAGKCYTVVGFSPLGAVRDLDLNLLAPPLYMTLAGQDLTHNNTPAIGASPSPMCPVIAFPLQYKLDVVARTGSGQVAVQLFSKAK